MSSFFTLPASQRKRKRLQSSEVTLRKSGSNGRRREERDVSISGSDISENEGPPPQHERTEASEDDEDDESEDEDPNSKRIRLAEQYLANTQKEILEEGGFDAAEIDQENLRRRMGERLKQDTAESKGKLYLFLAEALDWGHASQRVRKMDGPTLTGCAIQGRYVYTVQRLVLCKWQLPTGKPPMEEDKKIGRAAYMPKRICYTRGDPRRKGDKDYQHHVLSILCVAASQDGKYVVTGGADNKIVVWDAVTLKPLKVFTQHRDSVTSLAFRRGTNQLFSASKDRTVKIWSLDELAYVETLFGHQDEVLDVSALAQEKCVTVGARDRTARLWKVVEESQLVFRGGGASYASKHDVSNEMLGLKPYHEGSMDRVACIDDDTFITGSDNGSLSLWNIHKKKPVFTYPLAHGLDPPASVAELSAEEFPNPDEFVREPHARWITALQAIPFSDVVISGSWDGYVRAWRVTQDRRRIEPLGPVGRIEQKSSTIMDGGLTVDGVSEAIGNTRAQQGWVPGVINDLSIIDRGDKGKDGILIAAAVGKEHRLGRWKSFKDGRISLILFEVSRKSSHSSNVADVLTNGDSD
ncbi:hypothetical protein M433DRAFT_131369 [Acidomyces richmondensis BFW]|nr:MAG: hypothetical protein FE78DRAFT_73686 [Acidomyces sp. 'richmondensis']KYG49278.1 hypothetical protein M433DRAFT_131369 [Acidomyces richmondensis BFW]